MRIEQPGIYTDMLAAEYFADPAAEPSLTQSLAKIICERSPMHAWLEHPRLNPNYVGDVGEPYSKIKAIGNAAHAIMIGRGKTVSIILHDDFKTKKAQDERKAAEAIGDVPILEKHYMDAQRLVAAARSQLDRIEGCEAAFREGMGEIVIAAEQDGTWFRSMIDWMQSTTMLYDLKTSGMSCAPHGLGRMMVDAGWDVQGAMHEMILDMVDPDNAGRRTFRFVAVENEAPYALTVAEMSESVLTMGRKKLAYAIEQWRECMASGIWPAYPLEIVTPQYPGYRETEWLNREIAHAERPAPRKMLTSLAGG